MWIIDLLVIRPSPHPRVLVRPSNPKVLWAKECIPILYPSVVFTFGFTIESIKEFGGALGLQFMCYSLFWMNFFLSYWKLIFKDLELDAPILTT
jgi:hypothetical protein